MEKPPFEVADAEPAKPRFSGYKYHEITLPRGRRVRLETLLAIRPDETTRLAKLTRELRVNGKRVRTRVREEPIPRGIH